MAEAALTALDRVSKRRRSDRAGMRLALRVWRRQAWAERGLGFGGEEERGAGVDGLLEAMARFSVDAAAAFSTAGSVRELA